MKKIFFNKKTNINLLFLYLALLIPIQISANIKVSEKSSYPFVIGEKLKYEITWGFISAGFSEIAVLQKDKINNKDSLHFSMKVKTTPFIDNFYKYRENVEGYTNTEITKSFFYKQFFNNGKKQKKIVIFFDWLKKEAEHSFIKYKNRKEVERKTKKPVIIPEGTFDPFSIVFYMRNLKFEKNKTYKREATDGANTILGQMHVVDIENIKINGKKQKAWYTVCDLEGVGGVFEKTKDAKIKIWFSADKRKIPLQLKSKVVIGSFVGTLISEEVVKF